MRSEKDWIIYTHWWKSLSFLLINESKQTERELSTWVKKKTIRAQICTEPPNRKRSVSDNLGHRKWSHWMWPVSRARKKNKSQNSTIVTVYKKRGGKNKTNGLNVIEWILCLSWACWFSVVFFFFFSCAYLIVFVCVYAEKAGVCDAAIWFLNLI